jgi:hypothetical protein
MVFRGHKISICGAFTVLWPPKRAKNLIYSSHSIEKVISWRGQKWPSEGIKYRFVGRLRSFGFQKDQI